MMSACFGIGMDSYRTCPQFLSADSCEVDSRGARHAWGLRCVGVKGVGRDDGDAVVFPWRDGAGGSIGVWRLDKTFRHGHRLGWRDKIMMLLYDRTTANEEVRKQGSDFGRSYNTLQIRYQRRGNEGTSTSTSNRLLNFQV